jgi:tetratricopeptide (TPR) repeat protein
LITFDAMKRWIILLAAVVGYACSGNQEAGSNTGEAKVKSEDIRFLEQQLKTSPDSALLRVQLAAALDSAGFTKEAIEHTRYVLRTDSANYGVWFLQATLLEETGDTTGAIHAYRQAVRVYAAPEALLSLANLYAERGDSLAFLYAGRVLDMHMGSQQDANVYFIEGVYYARRGAVEKAEELFNKSIRNNYTFMEAYIEKGMLYFDRKDYRKALEVFTFASRVNNLYADAYYYMGRCYEMTGQKDSARLRFEQSLKLDRNLKESKAALQRLSS